MIIKIRDKEFKIKFVSNYVHKLYNSMTKGVVALGKLSDRSMEAFSDLEAEKITAEEADYIGKDIEKCRLDLIDSISNDRLEAITEVLNCPENKPNAFDPEWWSKRTEINDLNLFLMLCIAKDRNGDDSENSSKKK